MKKRIVLKVILAAFLVVPVLIGILQVVKHYDNRISNKREYDTFNFTFNESFSGNAWDLTMNNSRYCVVSLTPYKAKKEMKEILKSPQIIQAVFIENDVRIYAILLSEYHNYTIIYTLNGTNFYCWNKEINLVKPDAEATARLAELYGFVPYEEIVSAATTTR
jgi:hypothetical protein